MIPKRPFDTSWQRHDSTFNARRKEKWPSLRKLEKRDLDDGLMQKTHGPCYEPWSFSLVKWKKKALTVKKIQYSKNTHRCVPLFWAWHSDISSGAPALSNVLISPKQTRDWRQREPSLDAYIHCTKPQMSPAPTLPNQRKGSDSRNRWASDSPPWERSMGLSIDLFCFNSSLLVCN